MKSQSRRISLYLSVCLPWLATGVPASPPLELTSASFMEIDGQLMSAKGRPNEQWRLNGLKAYVQGHYEESIQRFEHAAGYADKYSQHYLSLIYWHGQGVPADHVRAYIWADLAAERGSRKLLAIREKMWAELAPLEREQAVTQGREYYQRYGDEAAKPRAEAEMRQFARDMTGSRVGYRSQMLQTGGGPVNGAFAVKTGANMAAYAISLAGSADELYGREGGLSRLQGYWNQQDAGLEQPASVEVGPLTVHRGQQQR